MIGSSAVSGINSIKWVDYATWLSQSERTRGIFGGISGRLVYIISFAEKLVHRVGAWKLYRAFFMLTLEQKPLDPSHKAVRGVIR